ncbi:hypothetical protein AAEX63_11640 [Luteococcus sp. H138]|uniref:hypothetical protein n=1 Tax=unclassified Luteococcus TaxID=2639923 RepID=UPI00313F1F7D
MTGRSPKSPRSKSPLSMSPRRSRALYRLATDRPIARRTAVIAAAALSGTTFSGCLRMRDTKPGTVSRVVPGTDEAEREFTGYYVVGKDFDSADVTIDEHGDRIVLAVDITTAGKGTSDASGRERSFPIQLASPRRKRPFVDRGGQQIQVSDK